MDAAKILVTKVYRHFMHDSLYRNSIFLIASTAMMAFNGFIFWVICARYYTPEQVGIATTIISSVGLISSFSLMGYNVALIRFIKSTDIKDRINTVITLVSLVATAASILFVSNLSLFSPKLIFIQHSIRFAFLFVIAAVIAANSAIFDSVFVGYRKASIVFFKSSIMGVSRIILPFILVALGTFGIFFASTLAYFVSIFIALIFLYFKFDHTINPRIVKPIIKEMSSFSLTNYMATFVEGSTALIIPILITNKINAVVSSYFYIVIMIVSALYIVPVAVSQATFAEGVHALDISQNTLIRSVKLIYFILIPAIFLIIILGKPLLSAFGPTYMQSGYNLLVLLTLTSIPMAIKLLSNVIFNIERKVHFVIIINVITVGTILSLSYALLSQSLIGIGIAWIVGESVGALLSACLVFYKSKIFKQHIQGPLITNF